MNADTELHALVNACLDGRASEGQLQRLNHLLRMDPRSLDAYLELADIHSCLASCESLRPDRQQPTSLDILPPSHARGTPVNLRPLQAAAAGLVIGLLSASAVWAYALPKPRLDAGWAIPILLDGFEDTAQHPEPGFPTKTGVWFGDLTNSAIPDFCLPREGHHVVSLPPSIRQKFSYAFRIFDLSEYELPAATGSYTMEVSASFHGTDTNEVDRYQIRLAAFREEPAAIKPLWNGGTLFDYLLKHVARTVNASERNPEWRTLKESIEIPSGTRSIVVALAAGMASESAHKTLHFLDDVQIRFVPSRP